VTTDSFNEALERLALSRQRDIAAFLGISGSKATEYKNGKRSVPKYIAVSLQAHLLLSGEQLNTLKQLRGVG
jgi:predicted transcriptional regulator